MSYGVGISCVLSFRILSQGWMDCGRKRRCVQLAVHAAPSHFFSPHRQMSFCTVELPGALAPLLHCWGPEGAEVQARLADSFSLDGKSYGGNRENDILCFLFSARRDVVVTQSVVPWYCRFADSLSA